MTIEGTIRVSSIGSVVVGGITAKRRKGGLEGTCGEVACLCSGRGVGGGGSPGEAYCSSVVYVFYVV